ncbi:MAG: GDSL-type esterase/lipase family protein [Candidatus Eisenbacteria bacterium]
MRVKRTLGRIGTVIASLVFVLVGLELATRVLRPQKVFVVTVNTWDPQVGTRQVPGARGFAICPEYEIDLIINSKGLRDREFPYGRLPGARRILCLGDSFVCGYGVQADEAYPKVLEQVLTAADGSGNRWEIINAGIGSTGTAHQLAYFATEGHRYEPDVVILGFFMMNDLWDNAISGLYALEDGALVKHRAPRTGARKIQLYTRWIPGYNTLFARSHLLNLLKFRVTAMHHQQLTTNDERSSADPDGDRSRRSEELTCRLLSEFRDVCAEHSCRPVVMLIPPPPGTREQEDQKARLVSHLVEQGIPCLDLRPGFSETGRYEELFYPRDGHWNVEGHQLAAKLLHNFLVDRSLL